MTQPATAASTGSEASKATFGDLSVSVTNDTALASLLSKLATGQHTFGATLTAQSGGPQPVDFYILDLADVVVTGVEDQPGGGCKVNPASSVAGKTGPI